MISQFFVISMRGDTILHKECKVLELLTPIISQDGPGCGQVHDDIGDLLIEGGDHEQLLGGQPESDGPLLCKISNLTTVCT
jgi:hypothetical protein